MKHTGDWWQLAGDNNHRLWRPLGSHWRLAVSCHHEQLASEPGSIQSNAGHDGLAVGHRVTSIVCPWSCLLRWAAKPRSDITVEADGAWQLEVSELVYRVACWTDICSAFWLRVCNITSYSKLQRRTKISLFLYDQQPCSGVTRNLGASRQVPTPWTRARAWLIPLYEVHYSFIHAIILC